MVPNPTKLEKRNLGNMQAISSIYENCAFLGDIARRLPHYISKLFHCNQSNLEKAFLKLASAKKCHKSQQSDLPCP